MGGGAGTERIPVFLEIMNKIARNREMAAEGLERIKYIHDYLAGQAPSADEKAVEDRTAPKGFHGEMLIQIESTTRTLAELNNLAGRMEKHYGVSLSPPAATHPLAGERIR